MSGTVGHSFACFAHVLTSVRVLKVSEEGMLLGFSVAEGFRLHATWAMAMKCWQKLMHAINSHSAAAPADPWASYLASKQPAVRAKWEHDLEIEPGQLQVGGGDITQIQAGAVKVDAEGVAMIITVKTLQVIAKVRSTKALAVVLPGCRLSRSFFDTLGLNESAVTTGMLRVSDTVNKQVDLKECVCCLSWGLAGCLQAVAIHPSGSHGSL